MATVMPKDTLFKLKLIHEDDNSFLVLASIDSGDEVSTDNYFYENEGSDLKLLKKGIKVVYAKLDARAQTLYLFNHKIVKRLTSLQISVLIVSS